MSKKKSSLANFPLVFWVLMLFIVLSISCLIFLMDESNYKIKKWGQQGIMSAEVNTAVAGLQALSDRSARGEISMAYAKKVGEDIIENAGLCATDTGGEIVVECEAVNKKPYSMAFEPFNWVISSR